MLLSLGFLAIKLIGPRTRLNLLQQRVLQVFVSCSFISNKLLKVTGLLTTHANYLCLYCAEFSVNGNIGIYLLCVIQRKRGNSDPDYADCNINEAVKDEAIFEDKIVDTMVLEDPQNMYQALEK